jgi:hypothetical protein
VTIVEFLTARYDEAEADARDPIKGDIHGRDCESTREEVPFPCRCGVPERILADIAAKRRIVKWCGERYLVDVGTVGSDPTDPRNYVPGQYMRPVDSVVLRFLASVYADHPDYREEWKV